MTTHNNFSEIKSILEGNNRINILMTGVKDDLIEHRKLNITQPLASEFKDMLIENVSPLLQNLSAGENYLIEYEPGYKKEGHEIEHISLNDGDAYNDIKTHIDAIPNLTNVQNFDVEETEFLKKLSYVIIRLVREDGKKVLLFRKYMHKKELTKKNKIKAIFSGGSYDKFEEAVLLFDEKIDCLFYENELYIIDTRQFHFIFQFYEKLTEKAQEVITRMTEQIPIQNVEELRSVCSGHPTMLAKIHSISRKDYIEEVTIEDIQDTIEEFQLDVDVINGRLVFDKQKRWDILKLLDEHYLGSSMTGRQYDSNSKRALK